MTRELAIGDIHGCYRAMLRLIKFADISDKDLVVWLGDYVDRGPDSAKVVVHLCGLPLGNNVFLRGNHEIMMTRAAGDISSRRSWGACGGDATWDSYVREFGGDHGLDAVPDEHWRFFENLQAFHETDTHIFVHAAVDSELEMSDQFDNVIYWGKFESIGPHVSLKHVVCGHSSQKDGVPKSVTQATCIDTWACGRGWLTCLDVKSGRYWQANQSGETHSDWL